MPHDSVNSCKKTRKIGSVSNLFASQATRHRTDRAVLKVSKELMLVDHVLMLEAMQDKY